MKKLVTLFSLLLLSQFAFSQQNQIAAANNEIIVQLDPAIDAALFVSKIEAQIPGLTGLNRSKTLSKRLNIHLFSFEKYEGESMLTDAFSQLSGVRSASWNEELQFRDSIPNDELFSKQWHMDRISLPEVWSLTTGGSTVNGDEIVVAVLDKGFNLTHPDLQGNIWNNPGEIPWDGVDNDGNGLIDDVNGWNFQDSSPFLPVERHGTNVAGIIGGKGNNNIGVAGVNWNIKMMFLSVRRSDEVVAAFDYILEMRKLYNETNGQQGAFIVVTNGSFGLDKQHCSEQPAWGSMYDPMGEVGILSVAATANENWDVEEVGDIPTSCTSEYLIAVTNTDTADLRVANAAYGNISIDLSAPGKSTKTTDLGTGYNENFGGTSSSCPHVAGSVALLYSLPCNSFTDLTTEDPAAAARLVRDAILKSVDPLASLKDKTVTGGRLNVFSSLKYLHAWCVAPVSERAAGDFKAIYFEEKNLVRVFPNPVSETLTIDYSNEDFTAISVKVFNSLGQQMDIPFEAVTKPFELQRISVDVKSWASGTYFIKLLGTEKKIVEKFVKI